MTLRAMVHSLKENIADMGLSNDVSVSTQYFVTLEAGGETSPRTVVWFDLDTTKTRSSSVVTRLELLLQELAGSRKFKVLSKPLSHQPRARYDIVPWRIEIHLMPVQKPGKRNGTRNN